MTDFLGPTTKDENQKDIEFNGRPALLYESDRDSSSYGTIAILITEDTIVTLYVGTIPESNLRAWDVIEKFTISPK